MVGSLSSLLSRGKALFLLLLFLNPRILLFVFSKLILMIIGSGGIGN